MYFPQIESIFHREKSHKQKMLDNGKMWINSTDRLQYTAGKSWNTF